MDPYEVLGLRATASNEEIEAQYRLLLRRHHPDMHHGEGPQGVAQAEYATRLLNQAMAQIRREREAGAAPPGASTAGATPRGPGATGPRADTSQARASATGTDPDNRAYARPRESPPPRPEGADATSAGPAHDVPWWAGPEKGGSPCPFCGEHLDDYPSYERHLHEQHRFRIETRRRRGIPITIGGAMADVLRVVAILVSAVVLLWLSVRIQLHAIVWFLLWLGIVALFLPSLLMRPRDRRR